MAKFIVLAVALVLIVIPAIVQQAQSQVAQGQLQEAVQTTDRHPTFDSTNPSKTMLDWAMSAFCAADNLRYNWQRNQCVPFQPET